MSTSNGTKKQNPKEKLHPIMVHIPMDLNIALAKYSEDWKLSRSRIAREGIEGRILSYHDDPFSEGFNKGLEYAVEVCKEISVLNMLFPSGTPVWKHIEEKLREIRREKPTAKAKAAQPETPPETPWES